MKFEKNLGILYSSILIPNVKSSSKVTFLSVLGIRRFRIRRIRMFLGLPDPDPDPDPDPQVMYL
jgi:hypothetical protein